MQIETNLTAGESLKLESDAALVVLSVCETAFGGVGRYQEGLRLLPKTDFQLWILLPDSDAPILRHDDDLRTFRRDRRGIAALARLLQAFFAQRRKLRPDLYFFNSTFALLPLLALRLCGDKTPAIYSAHCWAISNYVETSFKGRVVKFVEGQLCGLANLVVNVSHGDKTTAQRLGYRGHQVVVENAVPDRTAHALPAPIQRGADDEIHLLFVGRFDRQKGLDILLAAFAIARLSKPNLKLHLVGDAVRGSDIPTMPDGVTHHGWCPASDIDAYYGSADALVIPSRWEGLPLTLPEALRNGTPVFVAETSDMGALITPGVTGGSFALNEQALSQCLIALERATLQAMRPAARHSYETRYAMDRFVTEMSTHMKTLLGRGSND